MAPDHTDNTLTDNVEDKPETFPLLRALDVKRAIDWVETLPEGDPLAGRVDTSRVFVYGHSYGGQTSWLLSGPAVAASSPLAAYAGEIAEPRIVAAGPLAGTVPDDIVGDEGYGSVGVPVLFGTGTADFDGQPQLGLASEADVTWFEIAGGCHETFTATDFACDGVEKERGLEIVATYVAAFATKHVLGADDAAIDAILDGTTAVDPLVTVTRTR